MSIPDFMITRPMVEQYMSRQFAEDPQGERPEPPRRPHRTTTALRLRLSAAINALATAIEPAEPMPECAPSQRG